MWVTNENHFSFQQNSKDWKEKRAIWGEVLEPGSMPPVEQFPFLWYLPGRWKKKAKKVKDQRHRLWTRAKEIVQERRARGDKRDSLLDSKLDEYEAKGWPFPEWAISYLFGEMVEAGAESTSNQLLTLVSALAMNPRIQARARVELDAVCGVDRAPRFSDFDKLPYVNCIVKEDDYYDNYLIPKGSTVFMATWTMHHDDGVYPHPDTFNPDRYLDHPKLANDYAVSADFESRDHYGYGAGRRMCPGIHLAERNMWRVAAKLIWAFDIEELPGQKLDKDAYTSAVLASPMPFQVKVTPRSDAHMATVKKELVGAMEFLQQFK
ncbi:hypothetical protein ACJ41O_001295 [Fusarium nematophilum]